MSMIALQPSMPVGPRYVVPSLAIRVRAIFPIYAKTTAALARVGCHRTLMKISECLMLRRAARCARKAAEQTDPQLKEDYLGLQQKRLSLARCFQTSERLSDFVYGLSQKRQPAQIRQQSAGAILSDGRCSSARHRTSCRA